MSYTLLDPVVGATPWVLGGPGQVGEAAEPPGQNELKDTDQDLIFVCRTLPDRKKG